MMHSIWFQGAVVDLQLPVQSVPIITKVVSSNPVHGEVYLQQVGGFFSGTPVSSTNKTGCHDITEILLKVTLNTIIITKTIWFQ